MEIPEIDKLPEPNSSTFGIDAYNFAKWMKDAAPAFNGLRTELLDALNASLLGTTATSTTTLAISPVGTTFPFVTQANKGFTIGMVLKLASTANPDNYMKVTVLSYNISTGGATCEVLSYGGTGSASSWSVFFDVQDPTILSVPTGETVPVGALIAVDDAGNSLWVKAVTTAILQAVTATSLCAVKLASNNVAIFWSVSGNNIYMQVVDRTGAPVVAATIVSSSNTNSGQVRAATLSNGNIVIVFTASGTSYPTYKIVSPTATPVVAETTIEAAAIASGSPVVDSLTGGGFAPVYATAAGVKYALLTNTGTVAKSPTATGTTAATYVDVCEQPTSGGFVILGLGTSPLSKHYDGAGTAVNDVAIPKINGSKLAASGSTVASAFVNGSALCISLSAHNANSPINGLSAANNISSVSFEDPLSIGTGLGITNLEVLGDGSYLGIFAPVSSSSEYPRWVRFSPEGRIYDSGIIFNELTNNAAISLISIVPSGQNGFSLVWRASNSNIKFLHINSGKLVGTSLGQVGSVHQYLVSGEKTVSSSNMLNIGGSKVVYKRQGDKVVI
jgi:hypothetical protein